MKRGLDRHHGPLTENDLPSCLPVDSSRANLDLITTLYSHETRLASKSGRKPSLHRALLRYYFRALWFIQPSFLIISVCAVAQCVALGFLIDNFSRHDDDDGGGGG
eukprot:CAMPEP_0172506154 /NCGR_PEP_ID=MMETSP1066-20121228/192239_1 /TAXON_ID=671091 /ORGANISM="Coscinodiscus wailesii, Strain CCMP2513" /LENGTH=105 /DNA_ID=CAMNT_0013283047 /DNA_START=278 /DNA_END=591 /DNA_ORIENTATION=+